MNGIALVTGASAGIGLQLAKGLAARGYDVIGVGASDRIERLPAELADVAVRTVRADLSTPEGVEELWQAVLREGRPLDVAVLNAGVSLGGAFIDTDLDRELAMLDLNVTGQVRLAKHVARQMAARRSGRILITSSMSALTPTPFESIYGPTRAFMYSFAQGLREELREHSVSVTALLPSATATEFHDRAGMQATAFGDNSTKAAPKLVADLGLEALFAGRDHVIGGSARVRRDALVNRLLPERVKAHSFAKRSRPKSA